MTVRLLTTPDKRVTEDVMSGDATASRYVTMNLMAIQ